MLRITKDHIKEVGPGGAARHIAAGVDFQEVLDKKAWFAGTPEETIAYLKELEDKYPGLENVMIAFPMGSTKAQFREQLERFAKEVMPAFKTEAVAV